jgi:hypothetical protein
MIIPIFIKKLSEYTYQHQLEVKCLVNGIGKKAVIFLMTQKKISCEHE